MQLFLFYIHVLVEIATFSHCPKCLPTTQSEQLENENVVGYSIDFTHYSNGESFDM